MNPMHTAIIQDWVQNEFRTKILDNEWFEKHLALIKVGHDLGQDPTDIFRAFLASAVCDAAGLSLKGN